MSTAAPTRVFSPDTSELTLWGLWRMSVAPGVIPVGVALGMVATIGANAFWAIGDDDPTLIGGWLARVAPLPAWAIGSLVVLLVVATVPALPKAQPSGINALALWRASSTTALLLCAYVLGMGGSEWLRHSMELPPATRLHSWGDSVVWVLHRSFFLAGAIPVLLVYLWLRPAGSRHSAVRVGDMAVSTRIVRPTAKRRSWRWHLGLWLAFPIMPALLVFHGQLDFQLLTSGRFLFFVIPVAAMALFNAISEELMFRGLMLAVIADGAGIGAAIWIQAALFGLLHFGSSPAPLGALTALIAAGFIGLYFGKSVAETGGLGWAVLAHALADFTFFSAQFVAPT